MSSRSRDAIQQIRDGLAALPLQTDLRQTYGALCLGSQEILDAWTPGVPRNNAPYQVLDLFSGCGGMSLGFVAVSALVGCFELVGGVDVDADARRSYHANFGVPCIDRDVEQIASTAANTRRLLKMFPKYDPTKPLVLIGCAPCQGFTSHRKRSWTETDPRNTLVADFARIAVRLKPAAIVMENVPELLSVKYWPYFAAARDLLKAHGYVVRQAIVNAASYAVPQDRRRALVMAYRKDFLLPYPPEETRHSLLTVRDAIGTLPVVAAGQQDANDPMHRSASHESSTVETIRAIPRDGGSRPAGVGPKCLDRVLGYSDVYGRLRWDRPSITLTRYARNPASGRYVHPDQDRGLTMREAARLQSFPDGFILTGTLDSVFKQIGEAVPARLACCIASSVLLELLASPPRTHNEPGVDLVIEPRFNTYANKTR